MGRSGVAVHHVGIHINRINRISDGDPVLVAEDVEDVAAITFRAVGNENLVIRYFQPLGAIVIFSDGRAQKVVAWFRAVAAETFSWGHRLPRLWPGGDD